MKGILLVVALALAYSAYLYHQEEKQLAERAAFQCTIQTQVLDKRHYVRTETGLVRVNGPIVTLPKR